MKPIEGAESEGAKGFFKGVGKGLIGFGSTRRLNEDIQLTLVWQCRDKAYGWCLGSRIKSE